MSITMDNIIASQGAQLTDDELQQLADIVRIQIRQRSSLSQGDLILDKGQAVYQRINGPWGNRKYTNVNDVEAIDLFRKGTGSGSMLLNPVEGKISSFAWP